MKLPLKKFNVLVAGVVLLVLVIAAIALKNINVQKPAEEEINSTPIEVFPTIDTSVDVDLQFTDNKKSMILTINNIPGGVETIEYEISYLTGEGIPKGNIGSIKVEGKKEVTRSGEELTLGTCSRGKCVYYAGVKKVSLSLKFHKKEGSSIFQKDYEND